MLVLCSSVTGQSPSGFEVIADGLQAKTQLRRQVAQDIWKQHGASFLAAPSKQTLAPLLAGAPEIQEHLLRELSDSIARGEKSGKQVTALIYGLGKTLSPGGADHLLHLAHFLAASDARQALLIAARAGAAGSSFWAAAILQSPDSEAIRRLAASEVLLETGPTEDIDKWLPLLPISDSPLEIGVALARYAERPLIPEKINYPDTFFSEHNPDLAFGILNLLKAAPYRQAEEYVREVVLDSELPDDLRRIALEVCEVSAEQFHWRRVLRDFSKILKDREDGLCEDIAWTAHRLGDKAGAKYLLKVPEQNLKSKPQDWRRRIELATIMVNLGDFSHAYKEFRKVTKQIAGTPSYKNLRRETWLMGARAACGSRHFSEGEDWLSNARMSTRELAEYVDNPEFEDALRKSGIRKLFGL